MCNWWLWSGGRLDPALAAVWEATKNTSQTDHAFTDAFTDKHRKNATYEIKAPNAECVKGVFMWEREVWRPKRKKVWTQG